MSPPDRSAVEASLAETDSPSRGLGDRSGEPAAAHRPAPGGSLLPREHGAYAAVAFPLITALALGGPTAVQLLWIVGCVAVFLAHEPLLIILGERGRRSRTALGARARKAVRILAALAIATGGLGWWVAPPAARVALILPLALGALLLRLILIHRERSLPGEVLASVTLSSVVVPIALAGGVSLRAATIAGAIWCAVSGLATLTVRATIARAKQATHHRRLSHQTIAFSAAATLAAFLLTLAKLLPALAAAAILPVVLLAVTFSILHVHPRHLRTMGWSLVGSNVITLVALLVGLR
ncbi:MAG: YwiC-like family protein [Deltaproteobacteria bacterium]|nr:YwiC-like family protein [Deltaproteobacteria bacterium]